MGTGNKVNLLLVDDRSDGLLALEVILRSPEYNLIKAQSGEEALRILMEDEAEICVILLDVQMPGMDGFETASLIKAHDKYRHVPIIFVTGIHGDPRFVNQGYEIGAIDYITKPYQPYILRSKVSVLVELHRKTALIGEMQAKEHQRALEETKQQLQSEFAVLERRLISLVENSSDFIALTDKEFKLLYLNCAGRQLVGIPETDPVTEHRFLDFVVETRKYIGDHYLRSLLAEGSGEAELCFKSLRDGETFPVWSRGFVIRNPNTGEVDAIATMIRDIRNQKETEHKLKDAANALMRSNAELQRFAWVASHDLKEPLRMISTYVGLIEKRFKNQLDGHGAEYIRFAVEGAQRMYSLVDGILAFSGIDRTPQRLEAIDCSKVFDTVMENLKIAIEEADADVTRTQLPTLTADSSQIAQLFQNLISNGIKFRRKGEPPVILVSAKEEDNQWLFTFCDNGIGLDPQYGDRIFDVFQRLHTKEQYPGTGVGLAICKKIVENHGGKIWVTSSPGNGATFHFRIPGEASQDSLPTPPTAKATIIPLNLAGAH